MTIVKGLLLVGLSIYPLLLMAMNQVFRLTH